MIQVTETFSIHPERYGWRVEEKYTGKSRKGGEEKEQVHKTWHRDLAACVHFIRERETIACETVEALMAALAKSYALDEAAVAKAMRKYDQLKEKAA